MERAELFAAVRTRRTFEDALDQLVDRIRGGELAVGVRLPSEREIAAQMGISRPTLREALKLLVEAGVIEVRGRSGGMFVRDDVVPTELLNRRSEVVLDEIGGILEVRRMVETQVAQLAGMSATGEDFAGLRETIVLQRRYAGDHARQVQLDERFHFGIARATGNPLLLEIVRLITRRLAIPRDMSPREPPDWELEVAIHTHTVDAIATRDPAVIDAAMDEHMSYMEVQWEEATGRRVRRVASSPPRSHPGGGPSGRSAAPALASNRGSWSESP